MDVQVLANKQSQHHSWNRTPWMIACCMFNTALSIRQALPKVGYALSGLGLFVGQKFKYNHLPSQPNLKPRGPRANPLQLLAQALLSCLLAFGLLAHDDTALICKQKRANRVFTSKWANAGTHENRASTGTLVGHSGLSGPCLWDLWLGHMCVHT